MGSIYRRYRRNSPEAVARVVASLLIGDDRISPRELDFMDRAGMFSIIGVERHLFMRIASELIGEIRRDRETALDPRRVRDERFDAALDAIEDRDQQNLVSAVLVYLAAADSNLDEEGKALVRHVFQRWNVSAETLEREFNVPRRRTRPYVAANRAAAE